MKLKQKISGCFRTINGAHSFVILRSIIETARKLGWNNLDTLETDATELRARLNQVGPYQTPDNEDDIGL